MCGLVSFLLQLQGADLFSEQAPSTSEIVGSILAMVSFEESVNALPKVVGFLRVLWFPPTGKVDRVG